MKSKSVKVTPEQEKVIRAFIDNCDAIGYPCPGYHQLLELIGFKEIAPGVRVPMETQVKVQFGKSISEVYKDEYADTAGHNDTADASASESSEGQ